MSPWRISIATAALLSCATARADVLHVDASAMGVADGSSWTDAFVDLQLALAAANPGDELWVAAGTYKPTAIDDPAATFQLISGVEIYGGFAGTELSREERDWSLNETILSGAIGPTPNPWTARLDELVRRDASRGAFRELFREWRASARLEKTESGNSEHVVTGSGVGVTAVLDGFTVTQAYTTGLGGGMLIDAGTPTVRNVQFRQNWADRGGGLALLNGAASILVGLSFADNLGFWQGGAVYCEDSELEFVSTQFDGNLSSIGGAISLRSLSVASFEGCLFFENEGQDGGGAIFMSGGSLEVEASEFVDNFELTYGGGALYVSAATVRLRDVSFRGNLAHGPSGGGAIALFSPDVTLINVEFSDNMYGGLFAGGGAMHCGGGAPLLLNVTFHANRCNGGASGGALYLNQSDAVIVNSIFSGNSADFGVGDEIFNSDSAPVISHSLIDGCGGSGAGWDPSLGVDGSGNLDADPRFVAPPLDLTLLADSPAVDTGAGSALPPEVSEDLAGNARQSGPEVDMGAYEFVCGALDVQLGTSWDGTSLQDILDLEYGVGAIDASADYLGTGCASPLPALWFDTTVASWTVREVASSGVANEFGWHVEDFAPTALDSVKSGVLFSGVHGTNMFVLPTGTTRLGFYMNPNGEGDATNAPEPELFYLNRHRNDAGPAGGGDLRPPEGGDPQCLVFDVTSLRGGVPTFVLAWEELDYGSPLSVTPDSLSTDNDFQDLVVEIQVETPIPVVWAQLEGERSARSVRLSWSVRGWDRLDGWELWRQSEGEFPSALHFGGAGPAEGDWIDLEPVEGLAWYWLRAQVGDRSIESQRLRFDAATARAPRPLLLGATPNPFNPRTTLAFELPSAGRATLSIHDLAGRHVVTLRDGPAGAGRNEVIWDGSDHRGRRLASGAYFYRLEADGFVDSRRVILLK